MKAVMFRSHFQTAAAKIAAAILLAGLSASCDTSSRPDGAVKERVSFVIDASSSTRAAVTSEEGKVVSLDVIVFRQDNGVLDGYARVESASGGVVGAISADITPGIALDWFVIANAPQGAVGQYTTKTAFQSGLASLTQGIRTTFVMMGSGSLSSPSSSAIPVALDRYACKVSVKNLTVDWSDAFGMGTVSVGRIALVNAVGTTPFSAVPTAGSVWYNKAGLNADLPAAVLDMVVKDYGGLAVTSSEPVNVESPLYCMPNPVVNNDNASNTEGWTPRTTRVSVELLIGGVSNWYPIDIKSMQCNKHYVINNLTVTGPGSAGPDIPVERSDVRFSILVTEWDDVSIETNYN